MSTMVILKLLPILNFIKLCVICVIKSKGLEQVLRLYSHSKKQGSKKREAIKISVNRQLTSYPTLIVKNMSSASKQKIILSFFSLILVHTCSSMIMELIPFYCRILKKLLLIFLYNCKDISTRGRMGILGLRIMSAAMFFLYTTNISNK